MSITHLLHLMARRWPVILVGILLTGAAGFVAIQDRPVYFARTQAVFMAPSSALYPNSLQTRSEDLIITAGAVAKRVMGPDSALKFASPETNLAEIPPTGRDYWVRLPDSGGQWAPHFAEQLLLVDVVGDSPEVVEQRQKEVIARISSELYALQREQSVDPVNDITITVEPETAVVHRVSGSKARALGMTAVLGAGLTTAAVVALELLTARRNHRRVKSAQAAMMQTTRLVRPAVASPRP